MELLTEREERTGLSRRPGDEGEDREGTGENNERYEKKSDYRPFSYPYGEPDNSTQNQTGQQCEEGYHILCTEEAVARLLRIDIR